MNTLEIKNLCLTYPNNNQAVKDCSLKLQNGIFGLLGPNGAGKSSLMKMIVGLQKPTSGTILFNGIDNIEDSNSLKKHLGFLPQDFGVYPKVSAYDLLTHLAILKGVNKATDRKSQINYLLEKVNLTAFKDKEAHTFSGGMKQRFGVAQALLGEPSIIILDEPTAGLDPSERNRFNSLLNDISSEIIVILSTHLVEDVRNLCSEMTIINSGQILCTGKPTTLISKLENKIWSKTIKKEDWEFYDKKFPIISQQLIERELQITVFSEQQPPDFKVTVALLEHVYFYALSKNSNL